MTTERRRAFRKRFTARLREEMFRHYGKRCTCCGDETERFLTLDHTYGDGAQHRREISGYSRLGGNPVYADLRRRGWPQDRYRILCMNCNWATRTGQPCPHKEQLSNS